MRLPAGVQRNEYTMFNRSASPASGSQQQYQTFGGGASDPRWSHNGGTWQSGQQPARQGGGSSAYSPGQAQSQQSPYASSTPYAAYAPAGNNAGQQQNATDMSAWAMPKQQLLQWGQMQPQVPALQPQQGMTPAQTWDTVSAVIGQVNNTAANQQVGTYLGDGAPPAGWGQTNYNPQQLWSQATDMVSQGWQNPFAQQSPPPPPPGVPSAYPGQAQPAQDPYAGSTPYGRPLGDALQPAAAAEPRRDVTFEQWKSMRDKALGPSPRAPRRPPPPPPAPAAPAPQPAQRSRPAANPFAGKSVALPAGMKPSQFTRQLDGSYLPNGVTQRPSMTRRQPRVINWSEMTQEEIANTRSPYLGGRRPSINGVPVGGDSQYGRRLADVLQPPPQPAQPRRDPRDRGTPSPRSPGYYSPMPAGTPQGLAPFFDQARQMDPNANPFQQRELAYQFRNMQQAQEQQQRQAVTDQANASWMNDQAQAAGRQFARNPASGPATQGRSGEYIEKKRRQKLQQDARNNAQLGDPNWARTQEKKNVVRKEKVRRQAADKAARERDAEVTSRRGTKEEFMTRLQSKGVSYMDAQRAAERAGYYFPDPMDKYF